MENQIESIEIINLKSYLQERYNSTVCFHFAITDIKFNCNARKPELIIKVNYHNDMENSIIFTFNKFLSHTIISESYLFDSKDNLFKNSTIISIAKISSIKDFMFKTFLFDFILGLTQEKVDDYFIFRILGQNYFVDILTDQLPKIEY